MQTKAYTKEREIKGTTYVLLFTDYRSKATNSADTMISEQLNFCNIFAEELFS
jgi:hypothetical protein